jgi:Histidine kinase-like ATPase domain
VPGYGPRHHDQIRARVIVQSTAVDGRRQREWTGRPLHEDAARARCELQAQLRRWDVSDDATADAVLVATELLANVVVHARSPFRLTADLSGPVLRVAVRDELPGPGRRPPALPGRGRWTGLRLVSAVAFRWGWDVDATGKTVWTEFVT